MTLTEAKTGSQLYGTYFYFLLSANLLANLRLVRAELHVATQHSVQHSMVATSSVSAALNLAIMTSMKGVYFVTLQPLTLAACAALSAAILPASILLASMRAPLKRTVF